MQLYGTRKYSSGKGLERSGHGIIPREFLPFTISGGTGGILYDDVTSMLQPVTIHLDAITDTSLKWHKPIFTGAGTAYGWRTGVDSISSADWLLSSGIYILARNSGVCNLSIRCTWGGSDQILRKVNGTAPLVRSYEIQFTGWDTNPTPITITISPP